MKKPAFLPYSFTFVQKLSMRYAILLPLFLILYLSSTAQDKLKLGVAFYNAENLFDTIDNPNINDEEYLPSSKLKWGGIRYARKIKNISMVIDSMNKEFKSYPALMGFCEIENQTVLEDVIKVSGFDDKTYKAIASSGSDKRGIQVGLVYNSKVLKYLSKEELIVNNTKATEAYLTRNVLVIYFQAKKETLVVFINHWPSRREGEVESQKKRVYAASKVREKIIAIHTNSSATKFLVMGDFNDHPSDKSIFETLGAFRESPIINNPFFQLDSMGQGSHYYESTWKVLDQIMISANLNKSIGGLKYIPSSALIFKRTFLLFQNKDGIPKPNRTYSGQNYHGGFSDHMPVYLEIGE